MLEARSRRKRGWLGAVRENGVIARVATYWGYSRSDCSDQRRTEGFLVLDHNSNRLRISIEFIYLFPDFLSTIMSSRSHPDDPLTAALAPPQNESQEDREQRLRAELEAKRRSDAIDDEIDRQRSVDKKGVKPIKVLLLGEALAILYQGPYSDRNYRTERIRYEIPPRTPELALMTW
jgi:hypothetical protein